MEKEIIPTARDFMLSKMRFSPLHEEILIEFAKLHCEAALKAAHRNMQMEDEDLEFTTKAYPLTNIT